MAIGFTVIVAIDAVMTTVAIIKKPGTVYMDNPSEQNPFEGKRVVFIESPDDPENADGKRGHLEAVGDSRHSPRFYEKTFKRCLDVILSFCALVILSPVFAFIALAIVIGDLGPVIFVQKRVGRNKRFFALHNVLERARYPAVCNKAPKIAA